MKPRVLVVDDDSSLAEMLGIVLRSDGFEPAFVPDGSRALAAFPGGQARHRPAGPDAAGRQRHRRLPGHPRRVRHPDHHADRQDRHGGHRAGPGVRRRRLRGQAVQAEGAHRAGCGPGCVATTRPAARRCRSGHPSRRSASTCRPTRSFGTASQISLTPLEFDLLVALARKPRQVFTREVLLEQVWGYRHAADTRLVNVHVQRLRSKVERDPGATRGGVDRPRGRLQSRAAVTPAPTAGPSWSTPSARGCPHPRARPSDAVTRCAGAGWQTSSGWWAPGGKPAGPVSLVNLAAGRCSCEWPPPRCWSPATIVVLIGLLLVDPRSATASSRPSGRPPIAAGQSQAWTTAVQRVSAA